MPKKQRPPETPEEQFRRFAQAAHEHGVEENSKAVEDKFRRLAKTQSKAGKTKAD